MTGFVMTQVSTPIIGQAAWLLGKIMDGIYRVMNGVFGIQNIGICIILLTVVIYTLMIPLTIKQQKFSKMSAAMNPEIQKIQKKYQGKKDQASMEKMQEETQLVYEKYGVSPTSGCLPMFIQFPFLWAMWYVIRGIPAYVSQVKDIYTPLIEGITSTNGWQKIMESIGEAKPILMDPSKYDYSNTNVLIDVLYKFQSSTWETLKEGFPALQSTIEATMAQLEKMNNFMGLNIAEAPLNLIKDGFSAGAFGIVIAALMIPVLAGLTQYLSVKMIPQNNGNTEQENQVATTMKTMNITMPLLSVFMCFTMPTGLGIYWITSAVVRMVQQFFINKHLSKMPMDELIQQNMEKAAKKRENKKQVESQYVNEMAQKKGRKVEKSRSAEEEKALEAKLENARKKNENAKEGSLASKANMVKKFNESNK
ncbi:MAG: membrane protein insertase YidC [Lachnospiraceae bacterium]